MSIECMIENGVERTLAESIIDAPDPRAALEAEIKGVKAKVAAAAKRKETYITRRDEFNTDFEELIAENPFSSASALAEKLIARRVGRANSKLGNVRNIESERHRLHGTYTSRIVPLMWAMRSKARWDIKEGFFKGDPKLEADFARAVIDGNPKDPTLKQWAEDYKRMTKQMADDFRAAGGELDELDDWGLPRMWDAKATKRNFPDAESFVRFMETKVDGERMVREAFQRRSVDMGKKKGPPKPPTLDAILRGVYESITTEGINKVDGRGHHNKKGGPVGRHNKERILHLKDADSYYEAQTLIGRHPSLFDNMMQHIDRMATDTAALRILPPDAFEELTVHAAKMVGGWDGAQMGKLTALYNNAAGRLGQGEFKLLESTVQAGKNIVIAGKLGNAMIAAMGDTAFTTLNARMNGHSALRVMGRQLKSMFDYSDDNMRTRAAYMALSAESFNLHANTHSRMGDAVFEGVTGKGAQAVMRGSLLSAWTEGGRAATMVTQAEHLHFLRDTKWADLPRMEQNSFRRYSVDEKAWDAFRTQELNEEGMLDFRTDASEPFHRLINTETNFGIPTPDAKVKAFTNIGESGATIGGAFARASTNLLTFSISVLTTHWERLLNDKLMTGMDKATYVGWMMAHTTIIGMMGVLAREALSGKEMRDVEDDEVMLRLMYDGMIAGGSLGLLDYFASDPYAYGNKGFGDKAFGFPLAGLVNDVTAFVPLKFITEEDFTFDDYMGEATRAIRRNAPSVWYLKPATQFLGNAIEETVAPDSYNDRLKRAERREEKEKGRGFWID